MQMVLARDYRLMSTKGYTVQFKKGAPTYVPAPAVKEAAAIGAVPVDGSDIDLTPEDKMPPQGPRDAEARNKQIEDAIKTLVALNERMDFNAAGVPTTEAISRVLGYKISAAERNPVWQNFRAVE